jgi:hypothetical protein
MASLSAAQIVADALAIAKCPGFVTQGGRALNFVLEDLCMHRNLKVNLVTQTIVATSGSNGPFNLEANYLRTYDLSYIVSGEPYFLNPASLREYDAENLQTGATNYPYEWASDLSAVASGGVGLLYIYPSFLSQTNLKHRYYLSQTDLVSPETNSSVPWFSDQDYLIQATAMRMMRITDDSRYERFMMDCDKMLFAHLLTEGDEQQVVKEVKLDPRRFKIGALNKPDKIDPF